MRPRPPILLLLLAGITTVGVTPAVALAEPAADPIDAIWKVRSVQLRWHSPSTYYYCDTLQRRIVDIMLTVGANELMDIKTKCSVGPLINRTSIRIVAGVPVEATKANVLLETTFSRHAARIAKARRWKLATPETVHRFRAVRKEISFANFPPGDCELLEAISEQVFPKFGIQLKRRLSCSGALSLTGLKVDALMPVAAP